MLLLFIAFNDVAYTVACCLQPH